MAQNFSIKTYILIYVRKKVVGGQGSPWRWSTPHLRNTAVCHYRSGSKFHTDENDSLRPLHTILLLFYSQCLCSNHEARLLLQIAALVAKQRQRLHSPNIPWRRLCRPRRILLHWPGQRWTTRKNTTTCFMREASTTLLYETKCASFEYLFFEFKNGWRSWHTGKKVARCKYANDSRTKLLS